MQTRFFLIVIYFTIGLVGCKKKAYQPTTLNDSKPIAVSPVNPNITPAAKQVLTFFYHAVARNKIISAQQLKEYDHTEVNHVYAVTGKYPAIAAYDLIFSENGGTTDVANERDAVVTEATAYWNAGGLIEISWHETNPLDPVPDAGGWPSVQSSMTEAQFDQMVTPGTALFNKWQDHVDLIASYLLKLQTNGVAVLWRPYHEMNGNWFWWGNKTPASYVKLWNNLYTRLTSFHGLNNLIWIWSPNTGISYSAYFPTGQVDLGGIDLYTTNNQDPAFSVDANNLDGIMNGKPFGLAENGLLPETSLILSTHDAWLLTWTTGWCDNSYYGAPSANGPGNTPAGLKAMYNSDGVITKDDLGSLN